MAVLSLLWVAIGAFDLIKSEFLSERFQQYTVIKLFGYLSWRSWFFVLLLLAIGIILEGGHSAIETRNKQIKNITEENERRNSEKPDIAYKFLYEGMDAYLSVTNMGKIADVWAHLRVEGAMRGGVGSFARWDHASSYKARVAKGETHNLLLAKLTLGDARNLVSRWRVHYATQDGVGMQEAFYSSTLLSTTDGQAPDIHLHVEIFSDPDCISVPKQCHVVLHSNRAEELSN